jgi:hypothetical protein
MSRDPDIDPKLHRLSQYFPFLFNNRTPAEVERIFHMLETTENWTAHRSRLAAIYEELDGLPQEV